MLTFVKPRRWRVWQASSVPWRPTVVGALVVVGVPAGCGPTGSNTGEPGDAGGGSDAAPDLDASGDASDVDGSGGRAEDPECPLDPASDPFKDQAIPFPTGLPRQFYSWTTEEQVDELRAGAALFSRPERDGLGRGFALESLAEFALAGSDPVHELAGILEADLFATARYAWTNPWATRLGVPGEDYGDQLLAIRLRPEAWTASFDGVELSVWDTDDQPIPLEEVLASPERIGAIYFQRGATLGGPACGTFSEGGNGYREFILGNLGMVEQWSLGTVTLLERLQADIALIEQFAELLRACPNAGYYDEWNADVACSWSRALFRPAYDSALSMPSALYYPDADVIDQLVNTLKADLFEIDPLVVTPDD
jgi:hypothetical protein